MYEQTRRRLAAATVAAVTVMGMASRLPAASVFHSFARRSWTLDAAEQRFFPGAGDASSFIEYLHPNGVVHGPATGGMDRLEVPHHHVYGGSHLYNHWYLNGFCITDPARAGTPLFRTPQAAWQKMGIRNMQHLAREARGINHTLGPGRTRRQGLWLRGAGTLGGDFILPPNIFDREPVSHYPGFGDIKERQLEYDVDAQACLGDHTWMLSPAYARNQIRYVFPEEYNAQAESGSLFYSRGQDKNGLSLAAAGGWWGHTALGGAYGLPRANSLDVLARWLHGQVRYRPPGSSLHLGAALTVKDEQQDMNLGNQLYPVRALERERITAIEPSLAADHSAWRGELFLTSSNGSASSSLVWNLKWQVSGLQETYNSDKPVHLRTVEGIPQDVLVYSGLGTARETIHALNAAATWRGRTGNLQVDASLGADASWAFMSGDNDFVGVIGPSGRLTLTLPLGGVTLAAGGWFEPVAVGPWLTGYLNTSRPTWHKYAWNDDGDGSFESGELGALQGLFGGQYHRRGDYKHPWISELYLGARFRLAPNWLLTLNLLNRLYHNPLRSKLPDHILANLNANDFNQTYHKDPSLIAEEYYELSNFPQRAEYWGLELVLFAAEAKQRFFFQLAASAYLMQGYATMGNGLYNDIGVIDEAQADPHSYFLEPYTRRVADRAYVIKISGGFYPWRNLLLSGLLRYRDGEPFTIYQLYDGNYGFTRRPVPWSWPPRATFALNLDLRIRYTFPGSGLRWWVAFDMYNVFGSNTELKEEAYLPLTGVGLSRFPSECVPPRSCSITVGGVF